MDRSKRQYYGSTRFRVEKVRFRNPQRQYLVDLWHYVMARLYEVFTVDFRVIWSCCDCGDHYEITGEIYV